MERLEKIAKTLECLDLLDEKIKIDLEIEKIGLERWGFVVPIEFLDFSMQNFNRYKELLAKNKQEIKMSYELKYLECLFNLKRDVKRFGWNIKFRSKSKEFVLDFLGGGMFLVNKGASGKAVLLDRFSVDDDFIITKSEKFRFVRS